LPLGTLRDALEALLGEKVTPARDEIRTGGESTEGRIARRLREEAPERVGGDS
jgi:hypothetical protein